MSRLGLQNELFGQVSASCVNPFVSTGKGKR